MVMMLSQLTESGPMWTALMNSAGPSIPLVRGETAARKTFWMITESAKELKSSVRKLALRSGLNANRSMSSEAMVANKRPAQTAIHHGTPLSVSRYIVYPVMVTSSP